MIRESFNPNAFLLLLVFLGMGFFYQAQAQIAVDYQNQLIVDSDLDGLTDQGEDQIYKTDPADPDSDGDGFFDGTEILNGTGALDNTSFPALTNPQAVSVKQETPWPWYVTRISGLVAFALLYISIFFGLVIRIRFLHKFFAPLQSLNAHGWIALQATLIAFLHGFVLIFDKFLKFTFASVFIPFASSYETLLVALGTIAFYLMVLLTATSYLRKHLSYSIWRAIHFLNIGLYVAVVTHAFFLGTDLRSNLGKDIFLALNGFLVVFMLVNMFLRIKGNIDRRKNLLQQRSSEGVVLDQSTEKTQ